MVLMVPLLIMATSLVSKINTSVALVKGWVNSFLAFMGQLYLGFYIRGVQRHGVLRWAILPVGCHSEALVDPSTVER